MFSVSSVSAVDPGRPSPHGSLEGFYKEFPIIQRTRGKGAEKPSSGGYAVRYGFAGNTGELVQAVDDAKFLPVTGLKVKTHSPTWVAGRVFPELSAALEG